MCLRFSSVPVSRLLPQLMHTSKVAYLTPPVKGGVYPTQSLARPLLARIFRLRFCVGWCDFPS